MDRRDALCNLTGLAALAALGVPARAGDDSHDTASLPDWIPKPGMRRNISRNVLADVDPCPANNCSYSGTSGQPAVLQAWCGGAFANQYGRLGAWITTGGGHGDYLGNEAYAFELDTLRWIRLNDPYPGGRDSVVDYDEGEYATGIPLSSHTYQHVQYLPPDLGGGAKGSLLLVVSYAAGPLAHGSGRAHACDLATGRWSRYSTNKAKVRLNATSATCFDADRHVYWRVPYDGRTIEYLSTKDRTFYEVEVGTSEGTSFGVDHVCMRDPVRDFLLVLDWKKHGNAELWGLDIARTGVEMQHAVARRGTSTRLASWMRLAFTGEPPGPNARGMALEWCVPLACFVGYPGRIDDYVFKLFPPASDPLTAAWRWDKETITGDTPSGHDKGAQIGYNRFRFAPSIQSFLWCDNVRQPMQAWRLRNT
jgi:hypothetical protein